MPTLATSKPSAPPHPLPILASQHLTIGRKLLAELVGPLLLDGWVLCPCPPVHVLLRQAQQACAAQTGAQARFEPLDGNETAVIARVPTCQCALTVPAPRRALGPARQAAQDSTPQVLEGALMCTVNR